MQNTVQTASTDIFPLKASNFIKLLPVYNIPPKNTAILYHMFNAESGEHYEHATKKANVF